MIYCYRLPQMSSNFEIFCLQIYRLSESAFQLYYKYMPKNFNNVGMQGEKMLNWSQSNYVH